MKGARVIVVGGGLAGLTAAIHLAKEDIDVILLEKEDFPHHKVCGEYVSNEILPYLEELGVSLDELQPAIIHRLQYSTSRGNAVEVALPLGGIGISRFSFDHLLYQHAIKAGVQVIKATVNSIEFSHNNFSITDIEDGAYEADIVLAAFGKRSNLDSTLKRNFFRNRAPWLAVKSHYKAEDFPKDLVALHNFQGGYCGLSRTETGAVNVCYLTSYNSFRRYKMPEKFKENVLRKNPFLDAFFAEATPILDRPLTIAQISFSPKKTVENHMLMLGDAAGLLHPLCGNGMAMAIHSAKIASEVVLKQLENEEIQYKEMEDSYRTLWRLNFRKRIITGRILQRILINQNLAEISQAVVSKMPFLLPKIIKRTHGTPVT